jgi:hypothetical protein
LLCVNEKDKSCSYKTKFSIPTQILIIGLVLLNIPFVYRMNISKG